MGSDSIVNSPVNSSWNSPEVRKLKRRRSLFPSPNVMQANTRRHDVTDLRNPAGTSTSEDARSEPQPTAPKRRAVSPGVSQSPLASPMSHGPGNGQKRFGNMQDTHN